MGIERDFKSLVRGLNPWAPLLAFVGMFQLVRESYVDAIFFFGVVAILIIDSRKLFPYEFPSRPKISLLSSAIFGVSFGVLVTLSPRGSALEVALMIGVFFVVLGMVWYKDSGPLPKATSSVTRSKWLWIVCGVLINLWELFSFVAGDLAGDNSQFPTISILMTPVIENPLGRVLALALWLMVGLVLIRSSTRRAK